MNLPETVLVVDDDPIHRTVISSVLKALGVSRIRLAESGPAALEILREDPGCGELIFLDLAMPEMPGQTFLHELTTIGHNGYVAICSGEESLTIEIAEGLGRWLGVNIVGAMTKPVTTDRVFEVLKKYDRAKYGSTDREQ